MTKNSLKRNQVVLAEDHQIKVDTKIRKVTEEYQKPFSCKHLNFLKLCKETSSKCYNDEGFSQKGNNKL